MTRSLTLDGMRWPRILSFVSGIGMMAASLLTIRHYFAANFPQSIYKNLHLINLLPGFFQIIENRKYFIQAA